MCALNPKNEEGNAESAKVAERARWKNPCATFFPRLKRGFSSALSALLSCKVVESREDFRANNPLTADYADFADASDGTSSIRAIRVIRG